VKLRIATFVLLSGLLVIGLSACGSGQAGASAAAGSAQSATAAPGAGARTGGARSGAVTPTAEPTIQIAHGVSAIGEVKAAQDSDLTFAVQGTVDQVLVKEGDHVVKGQTLALLDTCSFDQKIEQAAAALDIAKAAATALTDKPKAADVAAAQAQVRQAQIAIDQARVNQPQNIESAQANLTAAQANLEAQRDKLSQAKTSADSQVQQNALALTQAQAAYAKAKSDWQYVQDTGRNPAQPSITNAQGKSTPNKINDSLSAQYYQTFVQAEAALHKAELTLQQSQVDAEQARQAEVTGVQSAEQQVAQARTSVDKLNLPSTADTVAMAQAALDQAKANAAKLNPSPSASDQARTSASVRQAQAALDAAKLDREHAELRAPFDGEVAAINIDPGDPSSTAGQSPMRLIDISTLHVDVNINDLDIGRVTQGQPARIVAEALSGKDVTGKVSYIAPAATISGNIRMYLVRIALDATAGLRPGMSVRVTLVVQ
jgi:multidrug resistance efflux pump